MYKLERIKESYRCINIFGRNSCALYVEAMSLYIKKKNGNEYKVS
jgi:hypothetical protein